MKREEHSKGLLDISDVIFQVYNKLDNQKNPEVLINKLVNYIYIVGFDHQIKFLDNDEALLSKLSDISKKQ